MAAKGRQPTRHLRTGDALGHDTEVAELVLWCSSCGTVQTEIFGADASVRSSLAGVTCMFCGRAGVMRLWRAA